MLRTTIVEARRLLPLDWRMARRYRLPTDDPAQPYYLCFDRGNARLTGESWNDFDEAGIVRTGGNGGWYNPVTISHYALYCYQRMCDGDQSACKDFLRHADYLLQVQRENGAYVYDQSLPEYGLSPGWCSCLPQGEAASVLMRAFIVTSEKRYRDGALRALEPLRHDVADGGVSIVRGGTVFFEEIAQQPAHILNGHLSAAFAVWEMCRFRFAPCSFADLHAAAVETLLRWLPYYDADGWSYYQLAIRAGGERRYSTIFYHQLHIAELEIYAAMTGRSEFLEMSRQWRLGLTRPDVHARIWFDIGNWAVTAMRRRAGLLPGTPWHSMMLN